MRAAPNYNAVGSIPTISTPGANSPLGRSSAAEFMCLCQTAAFNSAPLGISPFSRKFQRTIASFRASAINPILRARLGPAAPKVARYH